MITIKINQAETEELVKPKDMFGIEHGEVYQQHLNGVPQKCFLIGTGSYNRPIEIWWNSDNKTYNLSSESKKELREYLPHVKYKKVNCNIKLTLDMKK